MSTNGKTVIDAITFAMSQMATDAKSMRTDCATMAAYEHLRDARKLLIAKYELNTEEIGR